MKYCPICEKRFDEEIIRFCTTDGTPLIEEAEPKFTELPSENLEVEEDDIGEITMIRRKDSVPMPPPSFDEGLPPVVPPGERIIIPTDNVRSDQEVRPRTAQAYYPPPESNTAKTVVLTVFLTLVVLGAGAGLFWMLQKDDTASNRNINANLANINTNLNTNLAIDSNFNFNSIPNVGSNYNYNINSNFNANVLANIKTPTPTPSPKPSPSVTPSPSPAATATPSTQPSPSPTRNPNFNVRPPSVTVPTATPRSGPRPTPNPTP